jgi:hypothetical protein
LHWASQHPPNPVGDPINKQVFLYEEQVEQIAITHLIEDPTTNLALELYEDIDITVYDNAIDDECTNE